MNKFYAKELRSNEVLLEELKRRPPFLPRIPIDLVIYTRLKNRFNSLKAKQTLLVVDLYPYYISPINPREQWFIGSGG